MEQILTGGHGRQTLTGGEALSCQMMRGCVSSGGTWRCRHQRQERCLGFISGDSISGVCARVGREKAGQSEQELARRGPADHFPTRIEEGNLNTWKAFSREIKVAKKKKTSSL